MSRGRVGEGEGDESSVSIVGLLQQRVHCPSLSVIVVMEIPSDELKTAAEKEGVKLLTFTELEALGKNAQVYCSRLTIDD